ncbi:MAG: hypothetical protein U0Q16_04180 [Bryobacteraceae bacterium]
MIKTHTLTVLVALAGIGALPIQADEGGHKVAGAWATTLTISGRPAGPIVGVMNVHKDHTALYSDTSQAIPAKIGPGANDIIYQTPYFGAWERKDNGYSFKTVQLVAGPDGSSFGGCTLTMSIELTDRDNFSGTATQACVDAKGQSVGRPQTVPFAGKRISAK